MHRSKIVANMQWILKFIRTNEKISPPQERANINCEHRQEQTAQCFVAEDVHGMYVQV